MVFQEPGMCLNPARRCGPQLEEIIRVHSGCTGEQARREALVWMEKAGLENPGEIAAKYPHQLSGGQKQRLMTAMAMAPGPQLLIADEPTSSLDSENAGLIMETLSRLCREQGTALLLITHDTVLAARYAGRCLVAENGTIAAERPSEFLFAESAPSAVKLLADAELKAKPPFPGPAVSEQVILKADNLSVSYSLKSGLFSHQEIPVLQNLSFDLKQGETLGISGPSGVGKSTLAGVLTGRVKPSSGTVHFHGEDLVRRWAESRSSLRGKISQVFQDPYGSLNPKMTVGKQIEETMSGSNPQGAGPWLERVGLTAADGKKYPHEFSGGQRQRIAIARALACRPELLICDECVSALDNVTKWEILQLLDGLRRESGITVLFISHDEEALRVMCGRVLRLS
jgi:peptide/nickel transport system ATP-binding protein